MEGRQWKILHVKDGLMPDSYQLQNCSSRNMMKTCGMKIISIFKTTTEITVEKDGKDESIYTCFPRRKAKA